MDFSIKKFMKKFLVTSSIAAIIILSPLFAFAAFSPTTVTLSYLNANSSLTWSYTGTINPTDLALSVYAPTDAQVFQENSPSESWPADVYGELGLSGSQIASYGLGTWIFAYYDQTQLGNVSSQCAADISANPSYVNYSQMQTDCSGGDLATLNYSQDTFQVTQDGITNAAVIASSTNVISIATGYLVSSVIGFLPLLLAVGIPLGLLWIAFYWFMHRKGRT